MKSKFKDIPVAGRALDIDEVRIVAYLRIMHSKVDELHQIVENLKRRHSQADIHKYADEPVLNEDIANVDELYLWFLSLKEESSRRMKVSGRR
jgi:hypothetical protein